MLVAMETPPSARSSRVRCRFRAEPARPLGCSEPATERTGRPELDRRCPTHTHCSARVLPVNLAETVSEPRRRLRLSLLRVPPARLSRVPDLRHRLKCLPSSPAPAPPIFHGPRKSPMRPLLPRHRLLGRPKPASDLPETRSLLYFSTPGFSFCPFAAPVQIRDCFMFGFCLSEVCSPPGLETPCRWGALKGFCRGDCCAPRAWHMTDIL